MARSTAVLVDGVMTHLEVRSAGPGTATLSIKGKDLSDSILVGISLVGLGGHQITGLRQQSGQGQSSKAGARSLQPLAAGNFPATDRCFGGKRG